jgi:GNAT superfamily N-acetyltransferase
VNPTPSRRNPAPWQPVSNRLLSARELEHLLPALVEILRETVNRGAPLGFLAPLTREEARDYWLSLRPDLQAGSRLLLMACAGNEILGSGQLAFPSSPNARHRAELQKLFVTPGLRGRGVGRSLMTVLHRAAAQRGRSLLLLNTRRGDPAEDFYKRLGYREAGVLPGWTVGSAGERYDHVTLYQELADLPPGSTVVGPIDAARR